MNELAFSHCSTKWLLSSYSFDSSRQVKGYTRYIRKCDFLFDHKREILWYPDYVDIYHKTESTNCFIIHWTKINCHVSTFSLTARKTKRANSTWLPLDVMHRGHTWDEYLWPWVSPWHDYCIDWLLQLWRHRRIHCTLSANQKRDSEFNV